MEDFGLLSDFKEILGSCYGLICLGDEEQQELLFLNHFTKWIHMIQELGNTSGNYGFGCDLSTEDFKLVKLLDNNSAHRDTRAVMIYSMKDHRWREKFHESWVFTLAPSAANFVADQLYFGEAFIENSRTTSSSKRYADHFRYLQGNFWKSSIP